VQCASSALEIKRFAALQRPLTSLFVRGQAPDELEHVLQRVR
jgi:hypothetical protein